MIRFSGTQAVALRLSGGEVCADVSSATLASDEGVLETWMPDAVQADSEPVMAARWEDVEQLLSSHLERFDSLYRRLA